MQITLYDIDFCKSLMPLTLTRPASYLRVGMLNLKDKWKVDLGVETKILCEGYLADAFNTYAGGESIFINSKCIPSKTIISKVRELKLNQGLKCDDKIVAFRSNDFAAANIEWSVISDVESVETPYDIVRLNKSEIENDLRRFNIQTTKNKGEANTLIKEKQIFISDTAKVSGAIINASDGPVYIGNNVVVLEGACIKGPVAILDQSVIKMAAQIYPGTTIGPNCTIGGEVKNVVFQGNSNKGHYGYLGDSVVGEFCNLGAGVTGSNMKNTSGYVNLHDYSSDEDKELQTPFFGAVIGDYTKIGIGSMLGTGTSIGCNCGIDGGTKLKKKIDSFSWITDDKVERFDLDKAHEINDRFTALKGKNYLESDKNILSEIYKLTQ